MGELFSAVTAALAGNPLVALTVAYAWGMASLLLSPCHFASVPLIIAFVSESRQTSWRYALRASLLFALGLLLAILAVGVATSALGRIMGDVGPWGNYMAAAILLLAGLHLVGVIPLNLQGVSPSVMKSKGLLAAGLLGLVFGLVLGPCTFAFLAPVLALSFKLATTRLAYALLLPLAYGLGHVTLVVVAGTSTGLVQKYVNWNTTSSSVDRLRLACGVLVIVAGLYWLYLAI